MCSRGQFSLSVAGCVVKPKTAYFIMAIKFRRYNKTALFFTKRAVIVELLGRFELPTSSLPTDWEPFMGCFLALSGPVCSPGPWWAAPLSPLVPSVPFPVWVKVWVRSIKEWILLQIFIQPLTFLQEVLSGKVQPCSCRFICYTIVADHLGESPAYITKLKLTGGENIGRQKA